MTAVNHSSDTEMKTAGSQDLLLGGFSYLFKLNHYKVFLTVLGLLNKLLETLQR